MKEIRSKYQAKNYEEVTYYLDNRQCGSCGHVFAVDLDKCPTQYFPDQARPFAKFYCPYCGEKHFQCI